jgi:hypothetical protein
MQNHAQAPRHDHLDMHRHCQIKHINRKTNKQQRWLTWKEQIRRFTVHTLYMWHILWATEVGLTKSNYIDSGFNTSQHVLQHYCFFISNKTNHLPHTTSPRIKQQHTQKISSLNFMKPDDSLPYAQEPPLALTVSPINPVNILPPCYFNISFNTSLSSPRSSKWSLPSRFMAQILHELLILSIHGTCPNNLSMFIIHK